MQNLTLSIFIAPALIATYFGMQPVSVETKTPEPIVATATPEVKTKAEPTIQDYAKQKVTETFGDNQWESFNKIIEKESNWNPKAQNPTSTAQGLGQFLKQTRANYGITVESSPEEQVDAVISYIKDRYSTPNEAQEFRQVKGWY